MKPAIVTASENSSLHTLLVIHDLRNVLASYLDFFSLLMLMQTSKTIYQYYVEYAGSDKDKQRSRSRCIKLFSKSRFCILAENHLPALTDAMLKNFYPPYHPKGLEIVLQQEKKKYYCAMATRKAELAPEEIEQLWSKTTHGIKPSNLSKYINTYLRCRDLGSARSTPVILAGMKLYADQRNRIFCVECIQIVITFCSILEGVNNSV